MSERAYGGKTLEHIRIMLSDLVTNDLCDRIEELERALDLEGKPAPWVGSIIDKLEREAASLRKDRERLEREIASLRARFTPLPTNPEDEAVVGELFNAAAREAGDDDA